MQLIALLLFLLSATALVSAVLFVAWWHRTYRKTRLVQTLHEDIGHIGISAILLYPKTIAPLLALLEEEYPRSEAVVIADLKENLSPFGELLRRYHLVNVNHSHLEGVRTLYRSRHRAYRRVVLVDLPLTHSKRAAEVGRAVASYDNILYLRGESIIERDVLTYCANIAASHASADALLLRSIVGADAHFERGNIEDGVGVVRLQAEGALAWRKSSMLALVLALILSSTTMLMAHWSEGWMVSIATMLVSLFVGLLFCVVWSVESKKSLFVRLNSVLRNCYMFVANATLRESKIRDTSRSYPRAQEQSRPECCREDVQPRR